MSHALTAIVVIKTLTLATGGLITLYAYRAYRRTASPALRALAVGFAVVTLGTIVGGGMDQVLQVDHLLALAAESAFVLFGFLAILCSLHAT
jgi:hypothetical protein